MENFETLKNTYYSMLGELNLYLSDIPKTDLDEVRQEIDRIVCAFLFEYEFAVQRHAAEQLVEWGSPATAFSAAFKAFSRNTADRDGWQQAFDDLPNGCKTLQKIGDSLIKRHDKSHRAEMFFYEYKLHLLEVSLNFETQQTDLLTLASNDPQLSDVQKSLIELRHELHKQGMRGDNRLELWRQSFCYWVALNMNEDRYPPQYFYRRSANERTRVLQDVEKAFQSGKQNIQSLLDEWERELRHRCAIEGRDISIVGDLQAVTDAQKLFKCDF